MVESVDVTSNKDYNEFTAKRTKMFNQVNRIMKLPDASFKVLINVVNTSIGEEAGDILSRLYQEKDMH